MATRQQSEQPSHAKEIPEWKEFAKEKGLNSKEIDMIKTDNKGDPEDCYAEVLRYLKSKGNEKEETKAEKEETKAGKEPLDEPVYPMRSFYHGQAVIINQLEEEEKYRETSKSAVAKFKKTFEYLDYKVQSYPPHSKEDLITLMESKLNITEGDDSFVCCIMAHGKDGKIKAKNGKEVDLQELQEAVDCPALLGCPKIFIIYACRGSKIMQPPESGMEEKEEFTLSIKLSCMEDFYTAYSTPKDYITPIDPANNACPYLDELCEVFMDKAEKLSLDEMVMKVHHNIRERVSHVDGKGKHIQMGQVTHTLRGPVYFKKKN